MVDFSLQPVHALRPKLKAQFLKRVGLAFGKPARMAGASMATGTQMKRSSALQKTSQHEANPFCAAHPEMSEHAPSRVQCEPEDAANQRRFHRIADAGQRVHVRANHVFVGKKRK